MRLNQGQKQTILDTLVKEKFAEAEESLKQESYVLADKMYKSLHGEENLKLMAKLPENYFQKHWRIRIRLQSGIGDSFEFSAKNNDYRIMSAKLINETIIIAYDNPIHDEIKAYFDKKSDLSDLKTDAYNAAKATIFKCATLKQLLNVWPEIEPFTECVKPRGSNLPSVQIQELNKIFDLPKEEAA